MKNWLVAIIIGNLGRLFNNPQLFSRMEDRLAESGPVKLLARTVVGLFQRGTWELQQLKESPTVKKIQDDPSKIQEELLRQIKEMKESQRRRY